MCNARVFARMQSRQRNYRGFADGLSVGDLIKTFDDHIVKAIAVISVFIGVNLRNRPRDKCFSST